MPLCNEGDRGICPTTKVGRLSRGLFLQESLINLFKGERQMTVNILKKAGASSDRPETWNSISWGQCNRDVQRLQTRIVKATKERRWNKVKALQHLLTHSFNGKALAVRRVTENRGKQTPGVDKVLWTSPKSKFEALMSLRQRGYKSSPLRRVLIPKANGKKRPLSIPTMKDRAMQALYKLALDPIAETLGDNHSYGFRKERSTADAIEQCFTLLSRGIGAKWILEADIEGCFDNISHEWLLEHIPMDRGILKKWLKAGFVADKVLHRTDQGTPQGGIISPILANMVLDGLGKKLSEVFPMKVSSRKPTYKVNFVRYCDDFIITGRSKEILEKEVLPVVETFLSERGLKLSKEKTKISHIDEGFDFLGQTVRKYDGKLYITPSKKSVKRFLKSIRLHVRQHRMEIQHVLIESLNRKIRGWCQYHRYVCSKRTFSKIRHELWRILWNWSTFRHPNKGAQWVKDKYFIHDGKADWCFACTVRDPRKGGKRRVTLYEPTRIPIRRHIKIKATCNPYDPSWKEYLARRRKFKEMGNFKRKDLDKVWASQKGCCPGCDQPMIFEQKWVVHQGVCGDLILCHADCLSHVKKSNGVNR